MVGLPASKNIPTFKEREEFVNMVHEFGVGKSTIVFNIGIVKLIKNYPKSESFSLSLHFLKYYFETIKDICKENANEFKYTGVPCQMKGGGGGGRVHGERAA